MKVGVIGGQGFVGSAFVRYLQKEKIDHCVIEKGNYSHCIDKKFDVLINANGNSKKFLAIENPKQEFSETVSSVHKSLLDFKYSLYVHCSTVDVYNSFQDPAFNSENATINISSISKYGLHKLLAEILVRNYAKAWLILRFGGFVGPGLKKNSIFDILNNLPLRVNIDSAYQYLPTDFAAKAVFQLISKGFVNEIFNLCGNGVISIREIITSLFPNYEIRYFIDNPIIERYEISIEKIKQEMNIPNSRDSVVGFIESLQ